MYIDHTSQKDGNIRNITGCQKKRNCNGPRADLLTHVAEKVNLELYNSWSEQLNFPFFADMRLSWVSPPYDATSSLHWPNILPLVVMV